MTTNSGNEYPLVSILCVVKNGVKSIKRAIDSVLAQDYPNIEIIIQDGASTDGTLEILQEYGDKIKLVSEPDSDGAEGLSRTFPRINGEFFGSCLSDEEMLPHAVSWGVKNLQENPGLGAVYGNCYKTDIEGNIKSVRGCREFDLAKLICVEMVPPFLCAFFRTSHFRQIQLSDPFEYNGDYEIWAKLGMKFPIRHINNIIMKSSNHAGSQTCQSKTYPLQVQSKKRIMDGIFNDQSTPDWIKSLRFRAYSGLYLWASKSLVDIFNSGYETTEQSLAYAKEYYLEAIKYEPDKKTLEMTARKLFKIGVIFYHKGELEKALEYVELPLRYDSCFDGVNQACAVVLDALGRFDQARDAAEAELKIKPGNQELIAFLQRLPSRLQVESMNMKDESRSYVNQNFIEDIPEHAKYYTADIENDALVIVVDMHDNILSDNATGLDGWKDYYDKNMASLCSMLEYCNDNSVKVQEALYYGTRNTGLNHIRFDYTLDDKLDYSQFSHIYFCGISLDQCVVSRPLGYFNIEHPQKTLLKNCSLQGLKYVDPINYGITGQRCKEVGQFENIKQLHRRVDDFIMINKINTTNWDQKKDEKYLSIIVTSRNDDHGGNMLHRTQVFVSGFAEQCRKYNLDAELVFVEWNPPADRKRLYEVLDWPDDLGPLTVRFIEVPEEVHNSIGNSDKFPLFQMIAKNVGIRRAKGKFVLATNIDVLLNDELMQFISDKQLDENCFYRIDRYDTFNQQIPTDMNISEQLEFCKNSLVRVQGLHGTKDISEMEDDHFVYEADDTRPHTNTCGNFTLMAKEKWFDFKAYPELPLWSIYVDGLLLHMAHANGLKQVILPEPMRVYHIEHETGWEVISETMKERPSLNYHQQYLPWCQQMIDQATPLTNNDDNWGYAKENFQEHVIGRKRSVHADNSSIKKDHMLGSQSLIDAFSSVNNRLYYRDQSAESLNILKNITTEYKPTKIVELGTLSGMSLRTWIAAATDADVIAVDLSFGHLEKSKEIAPLDLSRVTLVEQDILKTDFTKFWSARDRVIFYVDAHDLVGVPIIDHVLNNAVPSLPDGSIVMVDDMWYCPDEITAQSVTKFFDKVTTYYVDSLQSFEGCFAPYWKGGFFIGFREVIPLLKWVNRHKVELEFVDGDKAAMFRYHSRDAKSINEHFDIASFNYQTGVMNYNPVGDVKVVNNGSQQAQELCQQGIDLYSKGQTLKSLECFRAAVGVTQNIYSILYAQGLCMAKMGEFELAMQLLELELKQKMPHPRANIMLGDIQRHLNKDQVTEPIEQKKKGLTIFTIPKAFKDHTNVIQRNAIKSWMNLNPRPEIILFGTDKGTKEIAEEFGLTHIPDVNCNEFGTPQIDYLFNRAQQSASNDIIACVNADIILFNDFIDAAGSVANKSDKFLMVGQRWDVGITEHVNFDDNQWSRRLLERVKLEGQQHGPTGIDYFVFKKGLWPTIPPFAIGRTAWDNWLVAEALRQGGTVVDATDDVTVIHQEHDYAHLSGGKDEVWNGPEAKKNLAMAGGHESIRWISHLSTALVDGEFVSNVARQNQKGNACFEKGDMKGSIDAFDRITKIEPENIIAHNNLGIAYQQDSEMSHALKSFAKAYQLDPRNRVTVFNIYRLYMQMGSQLDADKLLSKYLGARPADTAILQEIAMLKEAVTGNKKCRRKISSTSPAVSLPVVKVE